MRGSIRFSSVKEFSRIEVKGSPLAELVSDDVMQTLAAESEAALVEFVVELDPGRVSAVSALGATRWASSTSNESDQSAL
jgi:hypothetical protein